jgi:hypothetical protein
VEFQDVFQRTSTVNSSQFRRKQVRNRLAPTNESIAISLD